MAASRNGSDTPVWYAIGVLALPYNVGLGLSRVFVEFAFVSTSLGGHCRDPLRVGRRTALQSTCARSRVDAPVKGRAPDDPAHDRPRPGIGRPRRSRVRV